jgi:two-component system sensor histidine kinase QseC
MTGWWRPSLVRRLVLALLAAFFLVWCVLVGVDYLEYRNLTRHSAGLELLAGNIADSLPTGDEGQAIAVVRAAGMQYNRLRKIGAPADVGELLIVLERRDGTLLHALPGARGLRIPSSAPYPERLFVDGREYRLAVRELDRWRLFVLEPVIDDTLIVRLLGGELLMPMLIAFPLVLLPLWLAVRRGLLPLHQLAIEIEGRNPDDFSPLSLRFEHAELQPLVAFNHLLATAHRGIERERAFVQDAAHELRTPLAVVDAQAHLLSRSIDPDQQAEARLALERAVQRASHLVHQLLTLASLEGGNRPDEQEIDLVRIVRDMVISAAPTATTQGIEVSLESPERLDATLDTSAFHSVLGNLLDNALAYCPAGTRVTITLGPERDGEREGIRLSVVDNGPGVSDEEMPRLFERFYRGQGVLASGSGLGLAIVQQAVRRLGGQLAVARGEQGRGLAVSVWFPNEGVLTVR